MITDSDDELPDIGMSFSEPIKKSSSAQQYIADNDSVPDFLGSDLMSPEFIAQQKAIEMQIRQNVNNSTGLTQTFATTSVSDMASNSNAKVAKQKRTEATASIKTTMTTTTQIPKTSSMIGSAIAGSNATQTPNTLLKMNPGTFEIILFVDNCEQSHA